MKRLVAFVLLACTPCAALAYIGPGLGLGTIGVVLGVLVSMVLALFAILWYPFKRLIRKLKARRKGESTDGPA
jgi:hypothetical protein